MCQNCVCNCKCFEGAAVLVLCIRLFLLLLADTDGSDGAGQHGPSGHSRQRAPSHPHSLSCRSEFLFCAFCFVVCAFLGVFLLLLSLLTDHVSLYSSNCR